MNCPVCAGNMDEKDFGGVKVDLCSRCNGIWFDNFEIQKLDEAREGSGEELKKALDAIITDDKRNEKINCPNCNIPLHTHRYRAGNIEIDECYSCGGIYLDAGELGAIREQFKDDNKLQSFVGQILEENPKYSETIDKAQTVVRKKGLFGLFRFIK